MSEAGKDPLVKRLSISESDRLKAEENVRRAERERQHFAQKYADQIAKERKKIVIEKIYPNTPNPLSDGVYAPTYRPEGDVENAKDGINPNIQPPPLKIPRPPLKP